MENTLVACPVDLEDALTRAGDDREFFKELLDLFLSDIEERLQELDQAAREMNAAKVAATAHSLKGAAANLSALRVRDAAWEIETRGRAGHLEGVLPLIGGLRDAVAGLAEFARTF